MSQLSRFVNEGFDIAYTVELGAENH